MQVDSGVIFLKHKKEKKKPKTCEPTICFPAMISLKKKKVKFFFAGIQKLKKFILFRNALGKILKEAIQLERKWTYRLIKRMRS